MELQIDISAPILSNYGLGGLRLRMRLHDIQELIIGLGVSKKGSFELKTPFEASYRLGNGEIEVDVDVRNGKIFKLIAHPGYRGRLFGKITVGMRVAEAMTLEPSLYYDEVEELILCKDVKGLAIDVSEIDPPPDLVPGMLISAISVYAEEITTLQGQAGD